MRHFIDSHKASTWLAVLLLMAAYGAWELPTAWIYLGMHGTYGLLWVTKSQIYPDKSWERPVPLWYGVGAIWGALTLYWVAPCIIVSRGVVPPPWYLGMCVALFGAGIFLHFCADMEKYVHLKLRPGTLLTGGLWSWCRNPNYLGERGEECRRAAVIAVQLYASVYTVTAHICCHSITAVQCMAGPSVCQARMSPFEDMSQGQQSSMLTFHRFCDTISHHYSTDSVGVQSLTPAAAVYCQLHLYTAAG
jgi:protein-S-isoprenylcysteine O-methyltransferase Ste14